MPIVTRLCCTSTDNDVHDADCKRGKREQYDSIIHQTFDALQTVLDMFERHPELMELDAQWPRGSVYGIVKAAYTRRLEIGI